MGIISLCLPADHDQVLPRVQHLAVSQKQYTIARVRGKHFHKLKIAEWFEELGSPAVYRSCGRQSLPFAGIFLHFVEKNTSTEKYEFKRSCDMHVFLLVVHVAFKAARRINHMVCHYLLLNQFMICASSVLTFFSAWPLCVSCFKMSWAIWRQSPGFTQQICNIINLHRLRGWSVWRRRSEKAHLGSC